MTHKKKIIKVLFMFLFILNTNNIMAQINGYKSAIGLRAGFTSGISAKHFVSQNAALEGVLGFRYHGVSVTGLYEWHSAKAFDAPGLSLEYGLGARLGFYNGDYYREYGDSRYYPGRDYTVFSLLGILGLEYKFRSAPFTIGFDIIPYIDLVARGDNFFDGSFALRYTF